MTITIRGAFSRNGFTQYVGPVGISLSEVRSPETNRGLKDFVVETFDDTDMEYAVDRLAYAPLLECKAPCFACSGIDKGFCTGCWDEWDGVPWGFPEVYLQLQANPPGQTCQSACDDGFSTDGDIESLRCQMCDASCATCLDDGVVGDAAKCVECNLPEYNLLGETD